MIEAALLTYSPRPPEAYSRPCSELGRVGIGFEMRAPERRAGWNLYWLSDPALDDFIAGDVAWAAGEPIDMRILQACVKATKQEAGSELVGELLLRLKPTAFVQRLHETGYKHLAPYRLRRDAWIKTISARANLFRGLVVREGTVHHVQFGQGVSQKKDETAAPISATIMTLEFRKT